MTSQNVPLIAVAHGSRDPRSAHTVAALIALVRRRRPDIDVRPAFLGLNTPSPTRVLDTVAAQGHRRAVVVPLLLGSAFHATVDLPGMLADARRRHPHLETIRTSVLGTDPRLIEVICDRVRAVGISDGDATTGVAVAGVGSSSTAANAHLSGIASQLTAHTGWQTQPCFATVAPTLEQAQLWMRGHGADRTVIAPWFLAPGLLTDRLAASGLPMAEPLGAHPLLPAVVIDRFEAACRTLHPYQPHTPEPSISTDRGADVRVRHARKE